MDTGGWQTTLIGVTEELDTTEQPHITICELFKLFLNLSLELSPDSPGNEIKIKQIPHI